MRTVAAFDFDGTICKGDAVIPFLSRLRGPLRTAAVLASLTPLLIKRDRDVLKRAMSARLLKGVPEAKLLQTGSKFADDLLNTKLFPAAAEKIRWHLSAGHDVILVSASYNAYLNHIASQLNINQVICTRIEVKDGVCTGDLVDGVNVRRHKKTELLFEAIGDEPVELYAYGNSAGDVPMLNAAKYPFMMSKAGEFSPWTSKHTQQNTS